MVSEHTYIYKVDVITRGSKSYVGLDSLTDRGVSVKAVEGSPHGICRRLQIINDLLDWSVAVQALRPAHLVFIDHFEATLAPIAVDECVDH